jgi:molybdopterin-guanine dinucleotide biosynthesis adapter protein
VIVVPIVTFAGRSGVGKTTFLEKLVKVLSERGISVCVIKHHHKQIEFDKPGKDTYRLKSAGAVRSILHLPGSVGMVANVPEEMDLVKLAERFAGDSDIVIAEGYKHSGIPIIEVRRKSFSTESLIIDDSSLIAVVADFSAGEALPLFDLEEAGMVADFLVERFAIRSRTD